MNFVEAIKSGFSNYVGFSGRAQRSAYWFWTLFNCIVMVVTSVIDAVVLSGAPVTYSIAALALILPSLAVSVRRLHDLDRTGWWLLLALTGIGGIVLLVWFCMRGTIGANRFGPDPLPK
jgi:uncharacterized membrane protein YhaH (DUF805 family)